MLRSLHIENIAVVERADVEFSPGLNVLTGETGAGKSIIIDALYAVSGARTSRELVRSGADKCVAAAVFDPEGCEAWCEENGISLDDGELVVQRSVTADGRGSARVNGMPVSVSQLRQLGALLVDIHGQNDGRLLLDEGRHLGYLDAFAGLDKTAYAAEYRAYTDVLREIDRLTLDDQSRRDLADTLRVRAEELEKAALRPGEEEELEARSELLRNSERLREAADGAYQALYGGEMNAVTLAGEARGWLERARRWSGELSAADESLKEAAALLSDAAERVRDFRESLDFSPEEFDRVESRLSQLRRLEKKYNAADEAALLAVYEQTAKRLEELEYSSDTLERLEKERAKLEKSCRAEAEKLTAARQKAAGELAGRVEKELRELSMPSVRFETELAPAKLGPDGADSVCFLMSANAGEKPGHIARIASGGELSRIMLALKNVFGANDGIPTAVFDEIDTGVSGIAASRVAEKLADIGRSKQVLCISHLPQIAAMASSQYRIEKTERAGRTYTTVELLDGEGRARELARLIGGDNITELTLASARESLQAAQDWRARR